MAQTGTNHHESGIAVRRGTHHTGTAAELPAEPLNDIVGPDVEPVLKEKIALGQGFLNSILHLLGSLFQLHCPQLRDHGFRFLMGGLLVFLSMDRLEHFGHQLYYIQAATCSHWKKPIQLALSSFIPSAAPKALRYPSSFTAIATRMATFSSSPPQLRLR